jgi:hypothetical protein
VENSGIRNLRARFVGRDGVDFIPFAACCGNQPRSSRFYFSLLGFENSMMP